MMIFKLFGFSVLSLLSSVTFSSPIDPLIGTWKIIDHRTGYYVSDIVIRKDTSTQRYSAFINKSYPRPGSTPSDLCTACVGVLNNQPLFGMQTLSGLKKNPQTQHYQNGEWINPHDGKKYNIEATLNSKQDQMKVTAKDKDGQSSSTLLWKKI